MLEVTESTFEQEVLQSTVPVLVDFYAPWCGPCRMLTPALEVLATKNAHCLKVVKLNIDESPNVAIKYEVASIPMLVIIKNGEVQQTLVGLQSEDKMQAAVNASV